MKLIHSEYDPHTGFTDEYLYDEMTKKLTIRRLQDVEGVLDLNKEQFNSHRMKKANYHDSNGLHHAARIPFVLIEKWLREDGFNWFQSTDAERRKYLNEYKKLLVRPGRL